MRPENGGLTRFFVKNMVEFMYTFFVLFSKIGVRTWAIACWIIRSITVCIPSNLPPRRLRYFYSSQGFELIVTLANGVNDFLLFWRSLSFDEHAVNAFVTYYYVCLGQRHETSPVNVRTLSDQSFASRWTPLPSGCIRDLHPLEFAMPGEPKTATHP